MVNWIVVMLTAVATVACGEQVIVARERWAALEAADAGVDSGPRQRNAQAISAERARARARAAAHDDPPRPSAEEDARH